MPEAAYLAFMGDVAMELGRVMKPDGHVFLNVGWNSKHPWRSIDVAAGLSTVLRIAERHRLDQVAGDRWHGTANR